MSTTWNIVAVKGEVKGITTCHNRSTRIVY